MNGVGVRLAIAAGLSMLLLPLGLLLDGELTTLQAVLLLGLGTAFGLWPKTLRLFAALLGMGALFLTVVLFTPLLRQTASALVVDQTPKAVDLIVILGGGMHCGAGQLESASAARIERGLGLWRAGYAPRITLSDNSEPGCPSQGLAGEKIVKALYGNDGPEIILLPKMKTTRTEANAVAQIARERGFKSILLVTSPIHSRRASSTFRQVGLEVISVVSAEPRFDSQMPKPVDRILALSPLAREILGLITYKLRGWLDD